MTHAINVLVIVTLVVASVVVEPAQVATASLAQQQSGAWQYSLRSGAFWRWVGVGAAGGAVAGAGGWAAPGLLPAASGLWGSVGVGALGSALSSGAGQVTANLLNPCVECHHDLARTMVVGGVTGGIIIIEHHWRENKWNINTVSAYTSVTVAPTSPRPWTWFRWQSLRRPCRASS